MSIGGEGYMNTVSKDLIGIAGVHWVVSKLSMRGMVAMPTVRNTGGIDILVSSRDGKRMASLQVKASGKKVKFWPAPKHDKVLDGKNCFYVFLRYIESDENFEAFLVSGAEVKKQVKENADYYSKKGRKEFPYFEVYKEDESVYRKDWLEFVT
jgi:hypothetical protein